MALEVENKHVSNKTIKDIYGHEVDKNFKNPGSYVEGYKESDLFLRKEAVLKDYSVVDKKLDKLFKKDAKKAAKLDKLSGKKVPKTVLDKYAKFERRFEKNIYGYASGGYVYNKSYKDLLPKSSFGLDFNRKTPKRGTVSSIALKYYKDAKLINEYINKLSSEIENPNIKPDIKELYTNQLNKQKQAMEDYKVLNQILTEGGNPFNDKRLKELETGRIFNAGIISLTNTKGVEVLKDETGGITGYKVNGMTIDAYENGITKRRSLLGSIEEASNLAYGYLYTNSKGVDSGPSTKSPAGGLDEHSWFKDNYSNNKFDLKKALTDRSGSNVKGPKYATAKLNKTNSSLADLSIEGLLKSFYSNFDFVKKFNTGGSVYLGGHVSGPGGPREDKVAAYLSPGEFVIRQHSAQQIGYANLDHMNKKGSLPTAMVADGGAIPTFAGGGGDSIPKVVTSGVKGTSVANKSLNVGKVELDANKIVSALNSIVLKVDKTPVPVDTSKKLSVDLTKPVPVDVSKPVPVDVSKPVPVDVSKPVPVDVSKPVPVDVSKPVPVDVSKPVPVDVSKPVPVDVSKPVPVDVSKPVPVDVSKPVPVDVSKPVPVDVSKKLSVDLTKPVPVDADGAVAKLRDVITSSINNARVNINMSNSGGGVGAEKLDALAMVVDNVNDRLMAATTVINNEIIELKTNFKENISMELSSKLNDVLNEKINSKVVFIQSDIETKLLQNKATMNNYVRELEVSLKNELNSVVESKLSAKMVSVQEDINKLSFYYNDVVDNVTSKIDRVYSRVEEAVALSRQSLNFRN